MKNVRLIMLRLPGSVYQCMYWYVCVLVSSWSEVIVPLVIVCLLNVCVCVYVCVC